MSKLLAQFRVAGALILAFGPVLATADYAVASELNRVQATVYENETLTVSLPANTIITDVAFASYGTPIDYQIDPNCHASSSLEVVSQLAIGTSTFSILATNEVFGDPCVGTYKRLSVVVDYEYTDYLNPPSAPTLTLLSDGTLEVLWTAPEASTTGTQVERYAIFFRAEHLPSVGWAVASPETNVYLSSQIFEITGGFDTTYYFMIRSDNDTLGVYSEFSDEVSIFVPVSTPTPTPSPTPTPTPTETQSPEPTESPSPTQTPTPSPTETPEPTPTEPVPTETPTSTPQPTELPTVSPTPTGPNTPSPSPTPTTSPTSPITPTPEITEPIIPTELTPAQLAEIDLTQVVATELTVEQVTALQEAAFETFETAEPGSPEYKQALDALFVVAQADDIVLDEELAAVPVLGAVASGLVDAVNFIGNVGSDMSPQVRAQSEKIVVSAIVVGQITQLATATSLSVIRR